VSATLRAVVEMAPEIQSSIRQAAARLGAGPERIRRRKIEEQRRQELDAIRARLLSEAMSKWQDVAKREWSPHEHSRITEARQARGKEEEARMKAEFAALTEPELRKIEAQWKQAEAVRAAEQDLQAVPRPSSPSPGM